MDRGDQIRLSLLTFLILGLIGVLIVYTGYQAAFSEKQFFRRLALDANRELSRMVAREFVHVFTSQTAVIDDLAALPSIEERDLERTRKIFKNMVDKHKRFRAVYLTDEKGQRLHVHYAASTRGDSDLMPIPTATIEAFLKDKRNYLLLEPYSPAKGELALTYMTKIDTADGVRGVVAGEIDFSFMNKILNTIRLGRTGQILIADRAGKTLFTSDAFDEKDLTDFKQFSIDKAFQTTGGRGSLEYGTSVRRLASFARVHDVALEPEDVRLGAALFAVSVTPTKLPNWLVIAQQHADEAFELSQRMMYNVYGLVVAGLFGALVIGKLWMDSVSAD